MHSWRSLTRTGAAGFWVVWGPVGGSERRSERIFIELFPSKMLAMLKGQGKSKHRGADIKIICYIIPVVFDTREASTFQTMHSALTSRYLVCF